MSIVCANASTAFAQTPTYGYEIVNTYPHDTSAFTEGLVYTGSALYESTGLYGSSSLRQVDLRTGTVQRSVTLPSQYFGEGTTIFGGKIFQLTWQSQTAFVYDAATFAMLSQFFYAGEGWGLTHDDRYLIMSDGTSQIRFLDPLTFEIIKTITVRDQHGTPLTNINELEYINGEIYANVWLTDSVVRIDATSGEITGSIDFSGLLPSGTTADVLNGIAYDNATGHLLVTGKLWPYLYEVRLTGGGAASVDGTMVPTTASQIVDNAGNVWTIGSNQLILVTAPNGVQFANGSGSKIYWTSSTVYVYGTDANWYQWTGSGWRNVGPTTPGGTTTSPGSTTTTSPDGAMVPTTASQIVDKAGNVWTIGSNQLILVTLPNGVQFANGSGSKIYWTSSTVYVYGTDANWYQWTGSGWRNVGPTTPGATTTSPGSTTTASPDGTMVPTTASQIVDNAGDIWMIGSNQLILVTSPNGVQFANGSGSKIYWRSSTLYVYGTDANWYRWTGSGWLNIGPTQP